MSMPKINASDNPINREQGITNVIESVALMETGLSHIINAEGEKIQKVVNSDDPVVIDDILKVNESAENMINSITKLEMLLQSKLEIANNLSTGSNLSSEMIIPYSGSNVSMSTINGGLPQEGTPLGFSSYADDNIYLDGNVESIDFAADLYSLYRISFSIPKDSVITGMSAFYSSNIYFTPINELQIYARIYIAKKGENVYYASSGILILEPKIPAGSREVFNTFASRKDLNIPVQEQDKILYMFYMTHDNAVPYDEYISGDAGGSILLKTLL